MPQRAMERRELALRYVDEGPHERRRGPARDPLGGGETEQDRGPEKTRDQDWWVLFLQTGNAMDDLLPGLRGRLVALAERVDAERWGGRAMDSRHGPRALRADAKEVSQNPAHDAR